MSTTGDQNNQSGEIDEDVIKEWIRRNLPRINENGVIALATAWNIKLKLRYQFVTVEELDEILRLLWTTNGTGLQDLINSHLPPDV